MSESNPVDFTDVLNGTMRLTVEFHDNKIEMTVLENFITSEYVSAVNLAATDPMKLVECLARIIRSWELYENEKPLFIDTENLSRLPYEFVLAIMSALTARTTTDFMFPKTIDN